MSTLNIQLALIKHFLSGGFGLPAIYENKSDDGIDKAQPFCALHLVPNTPSAVGLGRTGSNEYTGFLQIDLFYPIDQGNVPALQKADEITQHFQIGTRASHEGASLLITGSGAGQGRLEESHYRIPITLFYRAHIARG